MIPKQTQLDTLAVLQSDALLEVAGTTLVLVAAVLAAVAVGDDRVPRRRGATLEVITIVAGSNSHGCASPRSRKCGHSDATAVCLGWALHQGTWLRVISQVATLQSLH